MKVIKVTITIKKRCAWSGYFMNYPTREELLPYILAATHGDSDTFVRGFVRSLVGAIHPRQWVISYNPYKISQFILSYGVFVGKVVMEEVLVADCVGFDPRKTNSSEDLEASTKSQSAAKV